MQPRAEGIARWTTRDDRLQHWLVGLQSEGRYTFTSQEAASALACSDDEARVCCAASADRAELASPEPGFYVIVRPEYRANRCPPASWFIDPWMQMAGVVYRVAGLTAAALHGASPQAAQVFQVLVVDRREDVTLGRVRVQFITDPRTPEYRSTTRKTETGEMNVLTAAETAFALVRHARSCGGFNAVAAVLAELDEALDDCSLGDVAAHHDTSTLQRLGYLLSLLDSPRAALIAAELSTRTPAPVWLRNDEAVADTADAPAPWLIAVDFAVEVDR